LSQISISPHGLHDESSESIKADRRVAIWLGVLVTLCFLLVQEGAISGYDGRTMYGVTQSMIERGTFDVDPELNTLPGRDGLAYSRYGLGLSLVAAVPYLALRPVASLVSHSSLILEAGSAATMPFIMGALGAFLYLLGRRLGAHRRAAMLVSAGALAGTFALPYGKEFFSEPLAALGIIISVERLLARRPGTSGLAMGLAVLTRPQNILFMPIGIVVTWQTQGRRAAWRYSCGLVPGVVATLAYNALRFGDPLEMGYGDVGMTTPFLQGAAGLFIDPRKSVVLFAPVVLLLPFAVARAVRDNAPAAILIVGYGVITFVLTATWFAWHGGWCWGPRLLLPAVLLAVVLVGPWMTNAQRTRMVVIAFSAGFLVSFPALLVSTQTQQLETRPVPPETHFLNTQPLASPSITRQAALIVPVTTYSIEHRYKGEADGRNYLRFLSLWQFGAMRELGRAGLEISLAGTAVLLVGIGFAARQLRMASCDVGVRGRGQQLAQVRSKEPPTGAENLEAMAGARNYHRFLVGSVLSEVDRRRRVLDFGAGTGLYAKALLAEGVQVTSVEPQSRLRAIMDAEGIPAVEKAAQCELGDFGTVYSFNVLEHIEDDEAALRELHARLVPGGILVLYVPAFQVLFSQMDKRVGHHRRYRRESLEGLVRSAQFRVVHTEYVDSIGFIAALAYRLLGRDGTLTSRSVVAYDRYLFPVSRVIDVFTHRLFGKNILLVACRD
jgi:SAM-dependent methyltransferase